VTGSPQDDVLYEVVCPHCGRNFQAELLEGSAERAERYRGFKCPHCKLFVPYERADEQELVEPVE
jgi:hypothetical protein